VPANALFRKGTGFDETVAAHGITAVLVAYGVDGDLFHVVDRKPGWAPIYFDETHVLFVREDAEPDALGAAPRLDWRAPERRSAPAPPDTEASDWLAGFWPHVADDVAPKALGRLGVLTGNLQLARDRYAEAVFVRPDDTEAQLSLGVIARALGDDAAADAALARAGVSVPTATAAAAAFASAGSLEAAAAAYDAIAARGGATPDVYEKLAQTSIAVGRLDDAERAYRRLVAMSPNVPQYWNGLAVVASRRGARDEALASFERSLAVAPAQPAVYTAMAMLRLQGGERDLARAALQKALEIDPSFTSARDQLAALGDR
jgi:tetratricopeptide (TPR) repeat protein